MTSEPEEPDVERVVPFIEPQWAVAIFTIVYMIALGWWITRGGDNPNFPTDDEDESPL